MPYLRQHPCTCVGDYARMLGFPWLDGKDTRMMRRVYNDKGGPRIIKADERRTSVNMAFDLWLTEDVLPWPGNANMAFDLWPTEDVLPWPGNANMAFDLRPTEDVLPWPGNANMALDLVPDLQCLLRTFYIRRYLPDMHEDNYNGIVIPI
ncbi:hypothetical protein Tco_0979314 [Tanacetum coccineum]